MELNNCIHGYLSFCQFQKNLSLKTLKAYKIDLRQFYEFSLNQKIDPCSKFFITNYITHLHKVYRPKSIKRKLACLKAFFNYLEYEEIIEQTPFAKIKTKFQEPFSLPKTIPLLTIQSILNAAYSTLSIKLSNYQHKTVLRDIAVLELLFATGIRVSELCSLQYNDVDLINQNIKILGKGSKERIIQIGNKEVINALVQYIDAFKDNPFSGYFFINRFNSRLSEQSVRNMINKYVLMANIQFHITPHMFRHSFATLLLEEDVDIRYIQKLLGHSSIVTTQIYTYVSTRKQRDILISKHPRNKIAIQ
jgi:Site-specific recombinase XerD